MRRSLKAYASKSSVWRSPTGTGDLLEDDGLETLEVGKAGLCGCLPCKVSLLYILQTEVAQSPQLAWPGKVQVGALRHEGKYRKRASGVRQGHHNAIMACRAIDMAVALRSPRSPRYLPLQLWKIHLQVTKKAIYLHGS